MGANKVRFGSASSDLGTHRVNGQSDKARLIGSWRHIGSTIDGKPRQGQGANPKGIIIYDAHGYMAVRGYEFAGDRLILRPIGSTTEVTWERIK